MDDFDKLLLSMVKEGKKTAAKGKKKGKKKEGKKVEKRLPPSSSSAWTSEALVLVSTNIICDNCGNEALGWEPSLYVERKNSRHRSPITQIEKLGACAYSSIYGSLQKRVEVIEKHSCTCPLCFGIGDNRADELYTGILPNQLPLFTDQGE